MHVVVPSDPRWVSGSEVSGKVVCVSGASLPGASHYVVLRQAVPYQPVQPQRQLVQPQRQVVQPQRQVIISQPCAAVSHRPVLCPQISHGVTVTAVNNVVKVLNTSPSTVEILGIDMANRSSFTIKDKFGVFNSKKQNVGLSVAVPSMKSYEMHLIPTRSPMNKFWICLKMKGPKGTFNVTKVIDMEDTPATKTPTFFPAFYKNVFDRQPDRTITAPAPVLPKSYFKEKWLQGLECDSPTMGNASGTNLELRFPVLSEPLTSNNYSRRFNTLLCIEEACMHQELRKHDIYDTPVVCVNLPQQPYPGAFVKLEVAGLLEHCPSLLYGDMLLLREAGNINLEWTAFVYSTHPFPKHAAAPHIIVTVSTEFVSMHNTEAASHFHIRFQVRRTRLRRMYAATKLLAAASLSNNGVVLFPEEIVCCPPRSSLVSSVSLQLHETRLNPEQMKAIADVLNISKEMILKQSKRNALPYVIFGPPGTGKTSTLVEMAKQVLTSYPNCKILLTAPSDSAADVLCKRLADFCKPLRNTCRYAAYPCDGEHVPGYHFCSKHLDCNEEHSKGWSKVGTNAPIMIRFNSFKKNIHHVPISEVVPYTLPDNGLYGICSHEEMLSASVVVCTCTSAGTLYEYGVPSGHFSHILVDEAGQSTEPETAIALIFADSKTTVVLTGDYMQLGPTVQAEECRKYGMQKSLLERLHTSYCNDKGRFDHCYQVLVRQYRSHPAIMQVSSDIFYNGLLKSSGDMNTTHSLLGWPGLPNKKFPLLFYGVEGKDESAPDSTSFYNLDEVARVEKLVRSITADTNVVQSEVGVISPYRMQVFHLRQVLRSVGLGKVRVGTVEDYQGQEERVIVLTTVRSSPEWLGHDTQHGLGVHNNTQRFNVAVTRAKALMIVVGNPVLLAQDHSWNKFIAYCVKHGSYKGTPSDVTAFTSSCGAPVDMLSAARLEPTEESLFSTSSLESILDTLNINSSRDSPCESSSSLVHCKRTES